MTAAPDDIVRSSMFWVLAPSLETSDPNLQYYYDFSQNIAEYQRTFEALGAQWQWQPVTLNTIDHILQSIRAQSNGLQPVVINLCDGDEVNGTPGISVIHALERARLQYTGADAFYYDITTSKIPMKQWMDRAGVRTPEWEIIDGVADSVQGIFDRIGRPLLIKPAVSGGSMGITVNNVVDEEQTLLSRLAELKEGYHGWDFTQGGIFAERFIVGEEYTTLIIGSADRPGDCVVYEPVERVFHPSLPPTEKFLSFDRLWEIYERESAMPEDANFYTYHPVGADMAEKLRRISIDAYCALRGQGYGRVDIRRDFQSGDLYVLEVNAQCGLSEDEDHTSIGAILRLSGKSFAEMIMEIIRESYIRRNLSVF